MYGDVLAQGNRKIRGMKGSTIENIGTCAKPPCSCLAVRGKLSVKNF